MVQSMGRIIRALAASLIVIAAYWNILDFWERSVEALPARDSNGVVVQRNRFEGVLVLLRENGYLNGKVGFATSVELTGTPRTPNDDQNFWQAQYVLFPFLLWRNGLNAPYVIIDSSVGSIADVPAGLHKIRDLGNGVVLYRGIHEP